MAEVTKVFVSAVSVELGEARRKVRDVLNTKHVLAVTQDNFPPDHRSVREILRSTIAECDAVVCLVGSCYGREPQQRADGESRRSYTQLEYEIALELRKPVYLFVYRGSPSEKLEPEPEELRRLQLAHLDRLRESEQVRLPFTSNAQLRAQVALIDFSADGLRKEISRSTAVLLHTELEMTGASTSDETWTTSILDRWIRDVADVRSEFCGEVYEERMGVCVLQFTQSEAACCAALALVNKTANYDPSVGCRVAIHTGEIIQLRGVSLSNALNVSHASDICQALCGLAGPGQVLLTRAAFDEARQTIQTHPVPTVEKPLNWESHGRFLIRNSESDPDRVDEAIEVCEVGLTTSRPADIGSIVSADSLEQERMRGWRPSVGQQIPNREKWVILRKLGEGGFGEVWLARHSATKQQKVFKFCFDANRLRSFKRELTVYRLLRDALGDRQDIARIGEVELDQPPFYLESEYVEAGNLADWSEANGGLAAIPLKDRLRIMQEICSSVAAAHSVGVFHRDLKPSNIFMRQDAHGVWHPMLADFGIGALADKALLDQQNITHASLMKSMLVGNSSGSGTRMYKPPEAETGDHRGTTQADVFALGVMLYQLATGDFSRPAGTGWEDILQEAMESIDNSVNRVRSHLLGQDIRDAIHLDPESRLASASELAGRLESLPARTVTEVARREATRIQERNRRLGKMVATLATLTVFAGALSIFALRKAEEAEIAAKEAQTNSKALFGSELQRFEDVIQSTRRMQEGNRRIVDTGMRSNDWQVALDASAAGESVAINAANRIGQLAEKLEGGFDSRDPVKRDKFNQLQSVLKKDRTMNSGYWQAIQYRLLRQFPMPLHRRELGTDVQQVRLSPDRKLLAVIAASGSDHVLSVWRTESLQPTNCWIQINRVLEEPDITWSADSKSIFVAAHNQTLLSFSGTTNLTSYNAVTGAIGLTQEHTGLVQALYATNAELLVVNHCDKSVQERFMYLKAWKDGDVTARAPSCGASVVAYSLANFDEIASQHYDGYINTSDFSKDLLVIDPHVFPQDDKLARNKADGLIYTTEKSLSEHKDKIDEDTKKVIETALAVLKEKLEWEDAEEIRKAIEELATVSHPLAEYQQAKNEAGLEVDADGAAQSGENLVADKKIPPTDIVVCSVADGLEPNVICTTTTSIPMVQFDESAELLITSGEGRGFRLWQSMSGKFELVKDFGDEIEPSGFVPAIARREDFALISVPSALGRTDAAPHRASGARSVAKVYYANLDEKKVSPIYSTPDNGGTVAASFSDSFTLACGSANGVVQLHDPIHAAVASPTLELPPGVAHVVHVSGQLLLTASSDGQLCLWDLLQNAFQERNVTGGVSAIAKRAFGPPQTNQRTRRSKHSNVTVSWNSAEYEFISIQHSLGDEGATEVLHTAAPPSHVLFSPNGRYVAVLSGVAPAKGGLSELPPLISLPGMDWVERNRKQLIPLESTASVYDKEGKRLVCDLNIDGPIVGVAMNNDELAIGSLGKDLATGRIECVDLKSSAVMEVTKTNRPFAMFHACDKHLAFAVITRDGTPQLYDRSGGRPIELLEFDENRSSVTKKFGRLAISNDGRIVVALEAGTSNTLHMFDVMERKSHVLMSFSGDAPPILTAHPSCPEFYIGTGDGELLCFNAESRVIKWRDHLGSQCIAADVSADGQLLAVVTQTAMVAVRETESGFMAIPDLPLPFGSSEIMSESNSDYWYPQFDEDANLQIGESAFLLLSPPSSSISARLRKATRAIDSQSVPRRFRDDDHTLLLEDLNAVDAFTLTRVNNPSLGMLRSIYGKFSSADMPSALAAEFAITQIRNGVNNSDTQFCLSGQRSLVEKQRYFRLSTADARQFLTNRWNFYPQSVLDIWKSFQAKKHPLLNEAVEMGPVRLALARSNAAIGKFSAANALFDEATGNPGFVTLEMVQPDLFATIRTEQAIARLADNVPPAEALRNVLVYENWQRPATVAGHRWLKYLLEERPKQLSLPQVDDDAVGTFLKLYDALSRDELKRCRELSTQLILLCPQKYQFSGFRPKLPIARAHAHLVHADIRRRIDPDADIAADVQAAKAAWDAYVKSATDQGIDERTLWLWEVSYNELLSRLSPK